MLYPTNDGFLLFLLPTIRYTSSLLLVAATEHVGSLVGQRLLVVVAVAREHVTGLVPSVKGTVCIASRDY